MQEEPIEAELRSPFRRRAAAMFPALRHRNYQLFFFGQGVSLIGTWMQLIALSWLVYRLTGSGFMLGVVNFTGRVFTFIIAPFAGTIADRVERRRLLIAIQSLAMLQAFMMAALVLGGVITVWQIILLSIMLGIVSAVDVPVRQSFMMEMVESRAELPSAIALNSFLVNGAKLVGPAMAGVIVGIVGEGVCFLLNGLSFITVIAALLYMKIPAIPRQTSQERVLENLKEGVAYAFHHKPIRALLILLVMINLIGTPNVIVLLPIFARDILGGHADTMGFLMAAAGAGAVLGALFLALRKSVLGLERMLVLATILLGLSMVVFAWSTSLMLSLAMQMLIGFATMSVMASCNTLLQTLSDDDKRGRIMGFYTVAFMGMAPFGSLLAGVFSSRLGAPWAVVLGGMGCLLAALVFARQLSVFKPANTKESEMPV